MAESTPSDEDTDNTSPEFAVTLRGYSRDEVDEYVRSVRVRGARQAAALREAEQRLTELGADPAVPLEAPGSGTIGARVERIVALAESEAREIREQAERDVADMRADLEREADQARRFREQAAKASAEESRRMIGRAEEEVAKLRETRNDLLSQLVKIGETVDRVTDRLEEKTPPKPREPLADAKARLDEAAAAG
jgi:DivIVA domain-containing protein